MRQKLFFLLVFTFLLSFNGEKPVFAEYNKAPSAADILKLYVKDVQKRINRPTDYDRPYAEKSYRTVVKFRIEQDGSVSLIELDAPSGNKNFDDSCLKSVKSRAPFRPFHKQLDFKAIFTPLTVDLTLLDSPNSN